MKHNFMAFFSVALMMLSMNTFSNECAGEMVVPSLTCMNLRGVGADVRLYMMEFQTCENGKIKELDRTTTGMHVLSQRKIDDIHTINSEEMEIIFADKRAYIDAENRADYLTFLMPKEVKMLDGDTVVEMKITDKLEPDYEGASSTHFKGTFKVTKANGKVSTGKLGCFVS
ncbi:MAG: hypothetical protein K2Q18_00565, partial [Bdellovibrionales bacterium]|nr:hypothetical protein [Bdellovibrionales bacterium]